MNPNAFQRISPYQTPNSHSVGSIRWLIFAGALESPLTKPFPLPQRYNSPSMNRLISAHPPHRTNSLLILIGLIFLTACTSAPTLTTLPLTSTAIPPTSSPIPSEIPDTQSTRNADNTQIAIDATARIAGLTALAPTNTPRPTFTLTPMLTPTPTLVPVPNSDSFFAEMQIKGYRIIDSGSIEQDGFVFSAYLFREPPENEESRIESTIQETWIIAFYRWDGQVNELRQTFYTSPYNKQNLASPYPYLYRLINWDDPRSTMIFDFFLDVDEELRTLHDLHGNSSDINQNGWPEFAFIAQYCPASCSRPTVEYQFFEIQTDMAFDLEKNLPGHLSLYPVSNDPRVFSASEKEWYGFFGQMEIPRYFLWENDQFVEVTLEFTNQILEWVGSRIEELKANYGKSFATELSEQDLVRIPLVYEQLNMRDEGLELFLEISDPSHWPNTDPEYACWLQITRAQFLSEYETNKPFTIPISNYLLTFANFVIEREVAKYDPNKYDLSACLTFIQDN